MIDVDGPQGEKLISSIARSFPFPPGALLIKTTSTIAYFFKEKQGKTSFF